MDGRACLGEVICKGMLVADGEEVRLVFTHIDRAAPDREYSFGIRSSPQNVWEGA